MNIDIVDRAFKPDLAFGIGTRDTKLLFTEYKAELIGRNVTDDELLDVAAYSMAYTEINDDGNELTVSVLGTIIDDYEVKAAQLAALPWDEIMSDMKNRIAQMNGEAKEKILQGLATGIEIQRTMTAKNSEKGRHFKKADAEIWEKKIPKPRLGEKS